MALRPQEATGDLESPIALWRAVKTHAYPSSFCAVMMQILAMSGLKIGLPVLERRGELLHAMLPLHLGRVGRVCVPRKGVTFHI